MATLRDLYNQVMERPLRILEIFNNFFGESLVDMQGFPSLEVVKERLPNSPTLSQVESFLLGTNGFILVKFPHVRVTNEYDKYTDIYDLFAKIGIKLDGTMLGNFSLNRATYSMLHITNNYMHSHVSCIPFNDFTQFQRPCTGTGPINSTMYSLSEEFDEDIWRLFCLELDKYVHVESVSGVPYHRLESLVPGGGSRSTRYDKIFVRGEYPTSELPRVKVAEFIKYLVDKEIFKFSYNSGGYNLAMSTNEIVIKISNAFIDWYNNQYNSGELTFTIDDLLSHGIISRAVLKGNKILIGDNSSRRNFSQYIGRQVCVFKNQIVCLNITDENNSAEENAICILNAEIIRYIVTSILRVINFRYGNTENKDSSSTGETILYL